MIREKLGYGDPMAIAASLGALFFFAQAFTPFLDNYYLFTLTFFGLGLAGSAIELIPLKLFPILRGGENKSAAIKNAMARNESFLASLLIAAVIAFFYSAV
jgi:hypothetical protein